MKICNINSYFLSSTVHRELEFALENQGYELKTYVPIEVSYKIRDEIKFKLPEHVEISRCYSKMDRLFFHKKQHKIMRDIKVKETYKNCDLLHAHSLFTNGFIAYHLSRIHNIPYVVTIRDTDLNIFFKKMLHLRSLGVKILEGASKIVFLSHAYKEEFFKRYTPNNIKNILMQKTVVIPSGINNFWLNNINESKSRDKEKIKLIFVGNIIKRKNIERIVKASELLSESGKNIELVIVGKVIDKDIANRIRKSKVVKLVDRVDKERLLDYYRENDIFIMPSLTESFGLVYLEAMSQGLPVIYSKNQGFDGWFKDGEVGYPVDATDINDIASKILRVSESYEEISSRCINNVLKFSWDEVIKGYINIYN